jgi:transaldolase
MSQPTFFFDTADTTYIRKIWDKLGKYIDGSSVIGITTNPNALAKVNCDTLAKFEELVPKMTSLVGELRGEGPEGLVYVQVPNSSMKDEDIIRWATYVNQFNGNGASIGLKIPHFSYALRLSSEPELQNLYLNVTGVSDANTIIKALSYHNVFFASIIPGRMEEVGIDANAHLEYLADQQLQRHQNIIAGSMRTIEGLKNSIYYHTVPTIGSRVWDLIDKENRWEEFVSYWETTYEVSEEPIADYTPVVTDTNLDLSKQFFSQMDDLGEQMFLEFMSQ